MNRRHKKAIDAAKVYAFMTVFLGDMHAKRVQSLASGTLGVIHGGGLGVATIGRALAQAEGLEAKHAIKQVDRLVSNEGINLPTIFSHWVSYVIAKREEIVVALDWTDFDKDDQSTLVLSMITHHGRATPLIWKTVKKSKLKGQRNNIEDELLAVLRKVVPDHLVVTILADRGFGDADLYALHWELKFEHIIRFRGNVLVTDKNGVTRPAKEWLPKTGRARILRDVTVTGRHIPIPAVVCVWAKGMKEPWFLACSAAYAKSLASKPVKLYGKRFSIEENFRDTKDIHFGMGLSSSSIGSPDRRDRLLLLSALAVALLTLLGAAAEDLGYDRLLKANTVKRRTHSLFTQGSYFYGAIPNMKPEKLKPLLKRFGEMLSEHIVFNQLFGAL